MMKFIFLVFTRLTLLIKTSIILLNGFESLPEHDIGVVDPVLGEDTLNQVEVQLRLHRGIYNSQC